MHGTNLAIARAPEAARAGSETKIPASARALLLALRGLRGGALTMHMPTGGALVFGDGAGPAVEIRIRDFSFARSVILRGDIGFAETWMDGAWDSPDLAALLTFLVSNYERIQRYISGSVTGRALNLIRHLANANTRAGSRRNILAHYDLGNSFYEAWLDQTMTYSSARFACADQPLEDAQCEKYRALARLLDLKPNEHVLEIGCGWGGFAFFAAQECGARVTALTISDAQLAYTRKRVAEVGLSDRIRIELRDYRDIEGQFDKIASIEMFEAVGERYWPLFFDKVRDALRPGGRAALQTINVRDDLFAQYRTRSDFIQRYIFPGGMLPSVERLRAETVRAGLRWCALESFGADYAETLAQWFDERFRRLWLFYLAYCQAGFETERVSVAQWSVQKP